jgi:YD repeat-containing protein
LILAIRQFSSNGLCISSPRPTPPRPRPSPRPPTTRPISTTHVNLTSKAGVSYTYGPIGSGPHQARNVGGNPYTYDANGNLQSGGNRTFNWMADNMPASVTSGVSESYTYDADGERVAKTVGRVATVYFQGLWEQTVGGASKLYYTFTSDADCHILLTR